MNFICNECLLPVLIRGQLVPNAERATPRFSKAATDTGQLVPNAERATPRFSKAATDTGQLVPNAERATPRFSKAARVATVLQLVSNVSVFAVKQPYI